MDGYSPFDPSSPGPSGFDPGPFDAVVVGGGPAGATAATSLARAGRRVLLLDRPGRIKPCGGAIPTRAIRDFDLGPDLMTARIRAAQMVAPSGLRVDMAIHDGFVGMVDRDVFDGALRQRAAKAGAEVLAATFLSAARSESGGTFVTFRMPDGVVRTVQAALLIGADGANSAVRRLFFSPKDRPRYVFAYHEIVRSPAVAEAASCFDPERCDVYYARAVSPDFYGWVFPHGGTTSVGVGSAAKGFDFREATRRIRAAAGLSEAETIRAEGAPLPLKPMKRWDDGRSVILAGDAAGAVAPSSGEGIYYAMVCGRLAAETGLDFLSTGRAASLGALRRRFMAEHGSVFRMLGLLQDFWYRTDRRREHFVALCGHPDVQRLVWESYLEKRLVFSEPARYVRVFFANMRTMLRFALGS